MGSDGMEGTPNDGRIAARQLGQVIGKTKSRSPRGTPGIVYGAVSSNWL